MSPTPKRIILVGAECSGKTTLARALAATFKTWWVPEYWRYYWEAKHLGLKEPLWATSEFIHIAQMQNQIEDHYATLASQVLLVDTDAFMTAIWHYRYLSHESLEIDQLWQGRQRDLIFFCQTEIPFIQDGTRDGELIRPQMTQWIGERLEQNNLNFIKLSGPPSERFRVAQKKVVDLLQKLD
jgi:NadR type nicotinamide-nucleotide adenylyltransferase